MRTFIRQKYPDEIFCHYLRNDHELNLFFYSIRISSYPIDRQYRRGPKTGYAESTDVCFDIENWDLDDAESDRDDIIKEIKDYTEKENIIKFIDN